MGFRSHLSGKYIFLAILYGLSTLIIPLATQYLVNSLALSSLMANTITFMMILLVFLGISQVLRFAQIILTEFIQREIFVSEIKKWTGKVKAEKSHYMLEIQTMMKSFSIAFGNTVELGLTLLFGFLIIISLHPTLLFLPVLAGLSIWLIFTTWDKAVESSVDESTEKYELVNLKFNSKTMTENNFISFLSARDIHFTFIKRATIIVGITFVVSQLYLLGLGILLIQSAQLSLGQLVSAEIILSGIMVSLARLPKTMEALYDLETSKIKLEYALEESHES